MHALPPACVRVQEAAIEAPERQLQACVRRCNATWAEAQQWAPPAVYLANTLGCVFEFTHAQLWHS